jgi:hypothetical protein
LGLVRASELNVPKQRKAGGDGSVNRDEEGRPRLLTSCWLCNGEGRRPSPTGIEGRTVKCQGCKGEGVREKTYKRVTSFIDVLDDKKFVQAWSERMVLLGIAEDPTFLRGVEDIDPESKEGKDELNRRAEAAKDLGGANRKSDQGTHLHDLSERVDRHESLPEGLPEADVKDMDAYREGTHGFLHIVHMEELVVNEQLGTAGTPDRVSSWIGEGDLIAPDGSVIGRDELLITDLKTGRVDFGALKMAMQLSIYSRSKLYVKDSHIRADMNNVNQKWGIIMHLPAGSGKLDLYWADLTLGWEAVGVAQDVHAMRRASKRALTPLSFAVTDK